MKTSKHWIVTIMMAMTSWLVVSFLDVIPAEMAPNCRPELKQFHFTFTSMQSLYGFGVAFSGCEYRSAPDVLGMSGQFLGGLGLRHLAWPLACEAVFARIKQHARNGV